MQIIKRIVITFCIVFISLQLSGCNTIKQNEEDKEITKYTEEEKKLLQAISNRPHNDKYFITSDYQYMDDKDLLTFLLSDTMVCVFEEGGDLAYLTYDDLGNEHNTEYNYYANGVVHVHDYGITSSYSIKNGVIINVNAHPDFNFTSYNKVNKINDNVISLYFVKNENDNPYKNQTPLFIYVKKSYFEENLESNWDFVYDHHKEKETFTNSYGDSSTICKHKGCTNKIVTSGDSAYCSEHSNVCAKCFKYIDEDALYCIDCLEKALKK